MQLLRPQLSVGQQFMKTMVHQFKDYERWSPSDPLRLRTLRASGLPFCALNFLINFGNHGLNGKLDVGGLYFTSVGTTVHTWIQDVMGPTQTIVGNWRHRKTKEYKEFSVHPDPEDLDWEYHELEIEILTLVGHIDCVYVLDKDLAIKASKGKTKEIRVKRFVDRQIPLAVLDYKTCSTAGQPGKLRDQGLGYTMQAHAYAAALQEQGLKVEAYGNVFIPRDNPFKTQAVTHPWTAKHNKIIRRQIKAAKARHKAALAAKTWSDFKALADQKCGGDFCSACKEKDPLLSLRAAYRRGKELGRWPASKLINSK